MKNTKTNKNYPFLTSLLFLALGIVLLIYPKLVGNVMCYALGVAILVIAGIKIFKFFKEEESSVLSKINLITGIVVAIFGGFVIARPDVILSFIPIVTGVFVLIDSFDRFKKAAELKSSNYKFWWIALVIAIILLVVGAILIVYSDTFLRVVGGVMVFDSVSNIWTISRLSKISKEPRKDIIDID